jgi:hypothetical protein
MMKNLLLVLALMLAGLLVSAQVTPPKEVTDAFAAKYADAKEVVWEQECPMTWDVEFMLGEVEKSALFTKDGKWLETESYVCRKELPAEVYKTLAVVFDGFRIEELEGIEKEGFTGYDIVLSKFNTTVGILAKADGTYTLDGICVKEPHPGHCCPGAVPKCCAAADDDDDEDEDEDETGDVDEDDDED